MYKRFTKIDILVSELFTKDLNVKVWP